MAAKSKGKYIAHRTERVGWGDLTVDLVAGEEVPPVPQDLLETLVANQQVYNAHADLPLDTYSQEYRNLQSVEDSEE